MLAATINNDAVPVGAKIRIRGVQAGTGSNTWTFEDTSVPAVNGEVGQLYRRRTAEHSVTVVDELEQTGTVANPVWRSTGAIGVGTDPDLENRVNVLETEVSAVELVAQANQADLVSKQNRDWSNTNDPTAITAANRTRMVNAIFALNEAQRTSVLTALFGTLTTAQLAALHRDFFVTFSGADRTSLLHPYSWDERGGLAKHQT